MVSENQWGGAKIQKIFKQKCLFFCVVACWTGLKVLVVLWAHVFVLLFFLNIMYL